MSILRGARGRYGSKSSRRPHRRPDSRRLPSLALPWVLTLATGLALFAFSHSAPRDMFAMFDPPQPAAGNQLVAAARPMPVCGGGRRISCVVDGDTFWVGGEKIRISSIDAPEVNGRCSRERELAQRATRRLSEILSNEGFSVERNGVDRYGRTLARIRTAQGEAGDILIREGLARPWRGSRENWCT